MANDGVLRRDMRTHAHRSSSISFKHRLSGLFIIIGVLLVDYYYYYVRGVLLNYYYYYYVRTNILHIYNYIYIMYKLSVPYISM